MCGLIFGVLLPVGALWWVFQLDSVFARTVVFVLGFIGYPKLLHDAYQGQGRAPDLVLDAHGDSATAVAFSPDGALLASGGFDGAVHLWDPAGGGRTATLSGHSDWVLAVAFAPDGRTLATSGADGTVRLWEVATGRETATLRGHTDTVPAVAFSPDGAVLASGSGDTSVRLWSVATGECVAVLAGHTDMVEELAFSPDGRGLATAGWDRTVRLWNTGTGECRLVLRGHRGAVLALAFSPDSLTLASGGVGGTVRLWDVARGGRAGSARIGVAQQVKALAYGRDVLAAGCRSGLVRLRTPAGGRAGFLATGVRFVNGLAFHPDGTTLAAASFDGRVRLWRDVTGR